MSPAVHLIDNDQLLAHVSCSGWVCVNDLESLSFDLSRHADTVAQTVIAALDLLEHSLEDTKHGHVEFFNELEGYWSSRPDIAAVGRTAAEVDESSRLLTSYVEKDEAAGPIYFLEPSAKSLSSFRRLRQRCTALPTFACRVQFYRRRLSKYSVPTICNA